MALSGILAAAAAAGPAVVVTPDRADHSVGSGDDRPATSLVAAIRDGVVDGRIVDAGRPSVPQASCRSAELAMTPGPCGECGCPIWWLDPYGGLLCFDCVNPPREAFIRGLRFARERQGSGWEWEVMPLSPTPPAGSLGERSMLSGAIPMPHSRPNNSVGKADAVIQPASAMSSLADFGSEARDPGFADRWWDSLFDPSAVGENLYLQPCFWCGGKKFWRLAHGSGRGRVCCHCWTMPDAMARKKFPIEIYEIVGGVRKEIFSDAAVRAISPAGD
jgi:hypothetical protein